MRFELVSGHQNNNTGRSERNACHQVRASVLLHGCGRTRQTARPMPSKIRYSDGVEGVDKYLADDFRANDKAGSGYAMSASQNPISQKRTHHGGDSSIEMTMDRHVTILMSRSLSTFDLLKWVKWCCSTNGTFSERTQGQTHHAYSSFEVTRIDVFRKSVPDYSNRHTPPKVAQFCSMPALEATNAHLSSSF